MAIFNLGGSRGGGMSPITMALLGVLAYRTLHGKGRLADMLGMNKPDGAQGSGAPGAGPSSGGLGGMLGGLGGGGLGGMLGGVLGGGALSGGLQDLLNRFQQNGHGDKTDSWVSTGANKPVAPHELGQVLGNDRIEWLMKETGLSREQLLSGLSQHLPEAVNKLTPNGQVPNEQELSKLISSR
ncbi:MAG: DUF937 domain-containing protein [Alphaproteobacteria bacterium]|nr:DUF937 domain-containing protein [Alphaproteobacteria bacterium]MBV9061722.1 DUF937 domain-containing protein [Alphaproteobacteria bacterium]